MCSQLNTPRGRTKEHTISNLDQLTPGTWNVDPTHSSISFVARHLMVTKVRGRFAAFSGTATINDDKLLSSVTATAEVASIDTNDSGRDEHLKSADFFDVANYPTIGFKSTKITRNGDDYTLLADLTIKGVTKSVAFDLEFDGVGQDPWGNTKAGFTAEAEVNRKDWGLEWNVALEAGGVLVSEKIKLALDIQLVKA